MQHKIELVILLVSVVFAWRRTAAWHIRQGRGKVAAHIGGLGAGIMAFVVVAGLIFVLDPLLGVPVKQNPTGLGVSVPAAVSEPAKNQ